MIDPETEAFDGGEDVVGGFGPPEGLGVFVVYFDEGPDIGFELAGGGVHAALQLLARQFGEPAFDLIDPDPEVGVKWTCQCGRRTSQALAAAVLWVA